MGDSEIMTTLKDISKATSLSVSTVSAVLGGRAKTLAISEKTIAKVEECARLLNYYPDLSARALRSSKSKIIGLLMPNIQVEFWQNMILGLQKEIGKYDGYIVLSALWEKKKHIRKCISQLLSRKVDGIITSHAAFLPEKLELPVAAYDMEITPKYDTILYGKREAVKNCVEYAAALGHKKIAIAGDAEGDGSQLLNEYAPLYGITSVIPENEKKIKMIDESFYYRDTENILGSRKENAPTFVVSLNNISTLNILKRAGELSLKIPEDLSLIAIDDSYIYPLLSPAVTTFIRSEEGFPHLLLKTLFARMQKKDMPLQRIVPRGVLLERASCCKYMEKQYHNKKEKK